MERSIWKPGSSTALSVHERLIWLLESGEAASVEGSAGGLPAVPLTSVK